MLVSERTNLPALDGDKTRIVRSGMRDVFGTLEVGGDDKETNVSKIIEDQLRFWTATTVATGVLLEWSDAFV